MLAATVVTSAAASPLLRSLPACAAAPDRMRLGLCTYLWGKGMDLPALIKACSDSGLLGVEFRTTHKHGVERSLSTAERKEVRKRLADSPVEWWGIGSNERFEHTDPKKLQAAINATKDFIKLSADIGGTGVKVKPNAMPKGAESIRQIGEALNTLGPFAKEHGQQIRVEVHGRETSRLPVMKKIMDIATHPSVAVCWNCNKEDLAGEGLEHNFNLVKDRFGDTVHVRELNIGNYPYPKLVGLLVAMNYRGWVLLECRTRQKNYVAAMIKQRNLFEKMVAEAKADAA